MQSQYIHPKLFKSEVPPENWTGDNIHLERGYAKMGRNRKYSSKFKAEVALEAIKETKPYHR